MNKLNKYAFYGSLRQHMYNNQAFKEGMRYIDTETIPGFRLYALNPYYPCSIKTGDKDDKIVVDLFEVSPETALSIHRMELSAGYEYEEVEINGTRYGIYLFSPEYAGMLKDRVVPGGDWVKHLQSKSEQLREH